MALAMLLQTPSLSGASSSWKIEGFSAAAWKPFVSHPYLGAKVSCLAKTAAGEDDARAVRSARRLDETPVRPWLDVVVLPALRAARLLGFRFAFVLAPTRARCPRVAF